MQLLDYMDMKRAYRTSLPSFDINDRVLWQCKCSTSPQTGCKIIWQNMLSWIYVVCLWMSSTRPGSCPTCSFLPSIWRNIHQRPPYLSIQSIQVQSSRSQSPWFELGRILEEEYTHLLLCILGSLVNIAPNNSLVHYLLYILSNIERLQSSNGLT